MTSDRRQVMILLLAALFLLPPACGIQVSVSSDKGSISEKISAADDEAVSGSTVIAADGLSHRIEGSGSLRDSHSVSNRAGARAEVGVDIRRAKSYSYDYWLSPGAGSFWRAPEVAAGEFLDVEDARHIQAYASASSAQGQTADVSLLISDPEKKASLSGYSNVAMASKNQAFASQMFDGASAPNGYIQTRAESEWIQLKTRPLRYHEWDAAASTRVDKGSMEGYSGLAAASKNGVKASEQMAAATGEKIQTRSQSASWTASLFGSLRRTADAKVSTIVEGTLTGYNASAGSSKDKAEAKQAGHVSGIFSSTAVAGKEGKTRDSNYGTEYDFDMQAGKDASVSSAAGTVGYYVDDDNPVANRIQGAVDASESGDTINVAAGTYRENVDIQKSLDVQGVGAGETVVDGQQSGSVFTIGSQSNIELDVALSGMTVQNGSGTYTERWPGEPLVQCGGGIWNSGNLSLQDSIISENTVNGYGSGIWSTGVLMMDGGIIYGNRNSRDGGGIWSSGELIVRNSTVAGNAAYWNGGGIWNSGEMLVERSSVSGNTAYYYGGGIANDMGLARVVDSNISGNTAAIGGGGVYNIFGKVSLNDSVVSGNTGNDGGGILNNGDMSISGGSISNNAAANGGGVWNMGTLNLNHGLISGNTASRGGGIYSKGMMNINGSSVSNNTAVYGGGIYNDCSGTLNLKNGSISDNVAEGFDSGSGGGIYNCGMLNLKSSLISNNAAIAFGFWGGAYGGGIYNSGIANLESSSISDNTAIASCDLYGEGNGGGIYNSGTVNLKSSSISNNIASGSGDWYAYGKGGGIYSSGTLYLSNTSVSDNAAESGEVDKYGRASGGGIYNAGTLSIDNSSIAGNTATNFGWFFSDGGGISNQGTMSMNGGSVDHNIATHGGGISNNGGKLNLYDGSISNNTANLLGGGGIFNYHGTVNMEGGSIFNNTAPSGGGICIDSGTVNLIGGSIDHNTAYYTGGGICNTYSGTLNLIGSSVGHNNAYHLDGGGIYNGGTANVIRSIISDNAASRGGGIFNDHYGTLYLEGSPVSNNSASTCGGGIFNRGTIRGDDLENLVHDNTPDDIWPLPIDWLPEV